MSSLLVFVSRDVGNHNTVRRLVPRAERRYTRRMNRRLFLLTPSLLLASLAHAAEPDGRFPRTSAVPGGVARVRLGAGERAPRVRLGKARVLVTRENGEWVALVGIALSTAAGSTLRVDVERA